MKYIRLFEDIDSYDETRQTILDICQDLIDDGFYIKVGSGRFGPVERMDISIKYDINQIHSNSNGQCEYVQISLSEGVVNKTLFKWIDAKGVVNHLRSYLGNRMLTHMIFSCNQYKWVMSDQLYDDERIDCIIILF